MTFAYGGTAEYEYPGADQIKENIRGYAKILLNMARRLHEAEELLGVFEEDRQPYREDDRSLMEIPRNFLSMLATKFRESSLTVSLRSAGGMYAISEELRRQIPLTYSRLSKAYSEKSYNLSVQVDQNNRKIDELNRSVPNLDYSDMSPTDRLLIEQAETLGTINEQSEKLIAVADTMAFTFDGLSQAYDLTLSSMMENVKTAIAISAGARFHTGVKEGGAKLLDTTDQFLELSAEFVGALFFSPQLTSTSRAALPHTIDPSRESRIDKLVRDLDRIKDAEEVEEVEDAEKEGEEPLPSQS